MNTQKLAQALTNMADALYEASEALTEQPAVAGTSAGVAGTAAIPLPAVPGLPEVPPLEEVLYADELQAEQAQVPQGSLAICPAHHKAFKEGKFGPFCPEKGIEPRWTNARGYCQITPKNVTAYLRQHAAVPA